MVDEPKKTKDTIEKTSYFKTDALLDYQNVKG